MKEKFQIVRSVDLILQFVIRQKENREKDQNQQRQTRIAVKEHKIEGFSLQKRVESKFLKNFVAPRKIPFFAERNGYN
jgi:hypothetical protein